MSQMVCFSVSLNASQFHLLIDGINVRQSGWCCNDPPGSGEQGHFHRHTKAPASVLNLSSPSVAIASLAKSYTRLVTVDHGTST